MSKPKLDSRFAVVPTAGSCTVFDVVPASAAVPNPKPAGAPTQPAKAKGPATPAPKAEPKAKPAGESKKAASEKTAAPVEATTGGSGAPSEPKSFARRDRLRAIEGVVQGWWEAEKTFEEDAPVDGEDDGRGKFFVTFPYPYMNGKLHLGHAFTITKADFSANFHRLLGERVLFPFAFHCTGMPIQAAANKLKRELETADDVDAETAAPAPASADSEPKQASEIALGTFRGKKTKLVSKTGSATQYDILLKSGVPEEEIPKFADPMYWLSYFPPYGKEDLKNFGASVDWRRSFITTSVNPFYDSFIRWQFNKLKALDRVKFGKRPTIYSVTDGQACADHDRSIGEGVGPQEYTLIKLQMVSPYPDHVAAVLGSYDRVYFVAATLRPETMYGQTNCFLLPEGNYGAFEMADGSVFICSERSMINMSYQDVFTTGFGQYKKVGEFTGQQLLGLAIKAPNAVYPVVYTLPLLTISMSKGTGVVTSVPSDAPDDYAALRDLQKKPLLREKFGITDKMVDFPVVEIIEIPGYSRASAVKVCEEMGIQSQNDREKLALAKEETYKKGFYEGILLVGSQAGKRVCDAKDTVKQEMIAAGTAATYFEPEKLVKSRTSDEECVVANLDQWYLDYGEPTWRGMIEEHIKTSFQSFDPIAQSMFEAAAKWLSQWACSRWFGLGTKLPWDPQFVIESLSDSTIYMAYYTIAHFLQQGVFDGSTVSVIKPEQLTDAVWDHVFLDAPYPEGCGIPQEYLAKLKAEFNFWYPMDLRVSGKDLIANHLTMSLYNHAAIWNGAKNRMPRAFFTNGHVQVDGRKMSKSEGNFLTLKDSVELYSADACRLALAVSGDSLDDANFEKNTADSYILRFTLELDWMQGMVEAAAQGKLREGETSYWDVVLEHNIRTCIVNTEKHYRAMRFRDAASTGVFGLQSARDTYRDACTKMEIAPHAATIRRYIEVQAILLAPICPHIAEHIWRVTLGNTTSVFKARWPVAGPIDTVILQSNVFMQTTVHTFRTQLLKSKAKPAAGVIYACSEFAPWQVNALKYLATQYQESTPHFAKSVMSDMNKVVPTDPEMKKYPKRVMVFAAEVMRNVEAGGRDALNFVMPFDEVTVLRENISFVSKSLELPVECKDASEFTDDKGGKLPIPGKPVLVAN